jgi:hypothetical protein
MSILTPPIELYAAISFFNILGIAPDCKHIAFLRSSLYIRRKSVLPNRALGPTKTKTLHHKNGKKNFFCGHVVDGQALSPFCNN